ncbi:MAG: 3-dehydroquinate synthase, partial [Candidatus Thioglobus sp.]|nr:3-dehydroquinate synthase [Candidatus Thioglobus sp.]
LGYGVYLHGEAISVGMLMAAKLSQLEGYLTNENVDQVKHLLENSNLPISINGKISTSNFMKSMAVDKKVIDGNIRLILLKKLGDAFICDDYQEELLGKVVADFCTTKN